MCMMGPRNLKLKEGYPIDAYFSMNGEGCMPQATALEMTLQVSERSKFIEYRRMNDNAA